MSSWSLRLAVVVPCALPRLRLMPQPPTQPTSPDSVRFRAGSTPLVSEATAAGAGLELVLPDALGLVAVAALATVPS